MKVVDLVWYQGFYRKNYLFFFLFILVFAFLVKPPTILFSPYFIDPMLEDATFFGITMGLLGLFVAKGLGDSLSMIQHPHHTFLHQLSLLPGPQLYLIILKQISLVWGLALGYALFIAGYAFAHHSWHGWAMLGGIGVCYGVAVPWLAHQIHHPRERRIRPGWQAWIGNYVSNQLSYISLLALWERYRRQVGVLKLVGLALWVALSTAEAWNLKTMRLSFWAILCLQGILVFRLRQAEDRSLFLLRNLPIPRWRRWFTYLGTVSFLFGLDGLSWLVLTGNWVQVGEIMLAAIGMGLLGIAALYYRQMELATYLNHIVGMFFSGFICLLFGLPLWLWGTLSMGLSYWIFFEEYYGWDGWQRE